MTGRVRIEVIPWLTSLLGSVASGRVILEERLPPGATVRRVLVRLGEEHPSLGNVLFDRDTGTLGWQVSVVLNDRLLELAGGLDAELRDGDTVTLLPAFQGGRCPISPLK